MPKKKSAREKVWNRFKELGFADGWQMKEVFWALKEYTDCLHDLPVKDFLQLRYLFDETTLLAPVQLYEDMKEELNVDDTEEEEEI
jgi:hypothetical protein